MTRLKLLLALLCITVFSFSQTEWKPKNVRLATRWTDKVSETNVLNEYPRPQMVRPGWTNLNGIWDYSITTNMDKPTNWDGKILVPYPLESSLSGVQKTLKPGETLWYRKNISHNPYPSKRTLLHFGAIDNEAVVFVNGKEVGSHKGGYTAFSFDITSALNKGDNEITVRVIDPTDGGGYPHGKQVSNPASIYYTPSSGIWQTVWIESVPVSYIEDLKITPDVDAGKIDVELKQKGEKGLSVLMHVMERGNVVASKSVRAAQGGDTKIELPIRNSRMWSPDDPFLYDLQIKILRNNKVIDEVTSYFGMRKVSVGKDDKGFLRIFLNNKYVYNLGVLDQGFWPDGLYTAPTDEALRFDIEAVKSMGFNTIRKHIKVEPARWYYHADKLGMLVWQDFVNPHQALPEGSKAAFEQQLNETMEQLYNYPSITTWVLFNEKWGQYDQKRLTEYVKKKDPTRLLNAHSGELLWVNEQLRSPSPNAWESSDIADIHAYPDPMNVPDEPAKNKIKVLGEFGGIGVFVPDHQWLSNKSWGYVQVAPAQLQGKYAVMNEHLRLLEREGLAASIYTQPYDVEGEENGLMTYDREIIKIPVDSLRKIHARVLESAGIYPDITITDMDATDPGAKYAAMLSRYTDGERDQLFLRKLSMMAAQVGDKSGASRVGAEFIKTLSGELNDDEVNMVAQMTTSTRQPGCRLMQMREKQFKKVLGERAFTLKMMNMIYTGEMKELIEGNQRPDWDVIQARLKPFGAPGEEILLRAKTVHYYNAQDWPAYSPVAKEYLEKFGGNLPENEHKMFSDAISKG